MNCNSYRKVTVTASVSGYCKHESEMKYTVTIHKVHQGAYINTSYKAKTPWNGANRKPQAARLSPCNWHSRGSWRSSLTIGKGSVR